MIEDPELRSLFQAESEERIKHLMDELKLLENDPHNHQLLDEVFREAHSLKGAARMLKLHDIEKVVHILEDYFVLSKKGTLSLTREVIAIFLESVDFIADLVEEAVTGQTSDLAMEAVIHKLRIVSAPVRPVDKAQSTGPTQGVLKERLIVNPVSQNVTFTPEKQEKILRNVQLFHEQNNRENFSTIRVNSQKIDSLSHQVSDLILIKDHMQPLLLQMEECAHLWEESYNRLFITLKKLIKLSSSSESSFQKDIKDLEEKYLKKLGQGLFNLKGDFSREINQLNTLVNAMGDSVRQLSMVHLSKLFDLFPRMVRDLARSGNKDIQLITNGGDLSVDKRIMELMKDPLMHLIRNCIDHGIETPDERIASGKPRVGTLSIEAKLLPKHIVFEVRDDGRGFNLAKIKQKVLENKIYTKAELEKINDNEIRNLIFSPGFSTKEEISEISGRGIGLSVVRDAILKMHGLITAESKEGQYSLFRIEIPLEHLLPQPILLVRVQESIFAIPMDLVENSSLLESNKILNVNEKPMINFKDTLVPLVFLKDFLEVEFSKEQEKQLDEMQKFSIVFIRSCDELFGLLVDEIMGEQKVVFSPPPSILQNSPNSVGTFIQIGETVCRLLNPGELTKRLNPLPDFLKESLKTEIKKTVLYVDDSVTAQHLVKRILEKAGYQVLLARDGMEGLEQLNFHPVDAIISDVEMPHMDGMTLLRQVKMNKKLQNLPFIFLSNLSEKQLQEKCLTAGAKAFLLKEDLNPKKLIETLSSCIFP